VFSFNFGVNIKISFDKKNVLGRILSFYLFYDKYQFVL